ncbi:unnamed protein product [Gemmata massiliana]|uniref:Uncharacterized protein n=1 Tax=Gemmata massiliana TaxID=1210884 RepID=A0A6P2D2M7_9BACT|nr:unnamed protein product [Gemmata massiliana]
MRLRNNRYKPPKPSYSNCEHYSTIRYAVKTGAFRTGHKKSAASTQNGYSPRSWYFATSVARAGHKGKR